MIARALSISLVAALCGAACRPASSPSASTPVDVLVVAPHPDDEVLIAGGIMMRAKNEGKRVAVVVVTNGDYTCQRNGYVREIETVNALAMLGVAEDDVHFLGYPDGHLAHLGALPLPPIERRDSAGECVQATGTYGHRGASHLEEHKARTGASAPYTADALEEDLAAILARLYPRDLYVTHPLDTHSDHAATYAYVRRALERSTDVSPRIHRAMVHLGPCWPNGNGNEPCPAITVDTTLPPAPLTPPYEGYVPSEIVATFDPPRKLAAIRTYTSQLGDDPSQSYLLKFARASETFWPETLARDPRDPSHLDRAEATLARTVSVTLGPNAAETTFEGYTLKIVADGTAIVLTRTTADAPIRTWPLPEDGRGAPHKWDVRIDPRDQERSTEITLRRDGHVLGVAIDPAR